MLSCAAKYSSSSVLASSPNAALDQIHSPTSDGHTSAIVSLIRQPIWLPRYINKEKGCAGMPACSRVGLSRASWKEGKRAERHGMLTRATGLTVPRTEQNLSRSFRSQAKLRIVAEGDSQD